MKVKELIDTGKINKDHWLAKARVYNEDVHIDERNFIIWKNGIWKGGVWKDGRWENGKWKCGIWKGGLWENGSWEGGIWEGGISSPTRCKWHVLIDSKENKIHIGCESRTVEEWDAFFASDDTIETERDTEQFRRIEKAYKVAKYALELEQEAK